MKLKGNWVIIVLLAVLVMVGGYMIYNTKKDNESGGIVIHEGPSPVHNVTNEDMELLEPSDDDLLDDNLVGYGPGTYYPQGRAGSENFQY